MTDAWLRFAALIVTQFAGVALAYIGYLKLKAEHKKTQITPEQVAEDLKEVKGDVKKLNELMISHVLDHNGGKGIRW